MSDDYSHTISGLLRRREDLMGQISHLRERTGLLSNDVEAIDRVLDSLGYAGDLPSKTARTARIALFVRNELARFMIDALKKAGTPLTSREIAESIANLEGKDRYDRAMMADITKRVGKAGRQLRARGLVEMVKDGHGKNVWRVA